MATSPYEDDEVSTPSGRTQMSDPYEDRDQANIARAIAEGMKNSGGDARIAEETGQFGEAGTSRIVKPTEKPTAKVTPKPKPKETVTDTGSDMARMINRGKSAEMPSGSPGRGKFAEMPTDLTKMSLADRSKQSREMARSGSGSTDDRSVNQRLRDSGIGSSISNYFSNFKTPAERKAQERKSTNMASGGKVTASSRGDGIAQRGKTRGKMC
jgi:hypothetical protein